MLWKKRIGDSENHFLDGEILGKSRVNDLSLIEPISSAAEVYIWISIFLAQYGLLSLS